MAWEAEVVAIGDELLSGAGVNSNAAWIGRRLGDVDVRVRRGTVVGDDVDAISEAIRAAAHRSDLVIVTGGLGPTADDRTRDALAKVLGGVPLHRDRVTAERIESFYAARGRTPAPEVLAQADVPEGVQALLNEAGAAPGLRAEVDGAIVVCLPGVPYEMQAIMNGSVIPEIAMRGDGSTAVAVLRTALVPESAIAERISDVEHRAHEAGIAVAYLPSVSQVAVRFVAPAGLPSGAELVRHLADDAAELLGDSVAVVGPASIAEEVVRLAREADQTVGTAESLTGGLVAAALTDVAGSSLVVRGGLVVYATELKDSLAGVDAELLEAEGAVHPEVARQLAEGARSRLGADYGVATTGVAGPDPQDGRPPGTVHVAVAGPRGTEVLSPRLRGDRERIRVATVVHALELLRRSLRGLPPPS